MESKRLKIKRIRSGNWTNEMKRMLFNLVRPRVHIIDSKSNKGEMIEKKLEAWELIRCTFEQHGYRLTQKQIRDQWCRAKFLARANKIRVKVNSVTPPKEKEEFDFQGEIDSLKHFDGTTSRYEHENTFTKELPYVDNFENENNQSSNTEETQLTTRPRTTTDQATEQKETSQLFKRGNDLPKVTPPSLPAATAHSIPSHSAPAKICISYSHHMNNISPYSNTYPNSNQNAPPHQERESHKCSSCPCVAAQESEYDKIGKAWASEIQKMNPEQQIYAKRAIAEIIFEGQLSALHRDSVTINHMDQQQQVTSAPIRSPSPAPYVIDKTEPDFDC